MPYKEHHKYERGMKDARYDINEVEDFPRGDTWEEAEAEYHWDTCVQMDMERRVEQGDVAEAPEVTVAESAAVVDRTQAAEEAREAERQRHKQWLVEHEEQRRAALVELASLAEAIAECPLCPLVSLDRLDAGTLRALYARHEHEQHDREEEETQAADKKAAPEDGEDEYSGVVEPVRVRPDGTPVFDINALPVDVWGVLMYYLDPYSLIQVCYASNWLRVLAEDCGAWEMCWPRLTVRPHAEIDSHTGGLLCKVKISYDHYGLAAASRRRDKELEDRMAGIPSATINSTTCAGSDDEDSDDDFGVADLFATAEEAAMNSYRCQLKKRANSPIFALFGYDADHSPRRRAFPWSAFMSFREQACGGLFSALKRREHEIEESSKLRTSRWWYQPPAGSIQHGSKQHEALIKAATKLGAHVGLIRTVANLELYRQTRKKQTRLYAAYRANLAAGMLHTASEYLEQVDFDRIGIETKAMLDIPNSAEAIHKIKSELRMHCLDVIGDDEVDVVRECKDSQEKLSIRVHLAKRETKNTYEVADPATSSESRAKARRWRWWRPPPPPPITSTKQRRLKKQVENVDKIGTPTTDYDKLKAKLLAMKIKRVGLMLGLGPDLTEEEYRRAVMTSSGYRRSLPPAPPM